MFEMSAVLRELYAAGLHPEDVVMPCECGGCGTMPARVTNVAGDVRRRCLECYMRDTTLYNDHWSN